jgi:hypothetical protein
MSTGRKTESAPGDGEAIEDRLARLLDTPALARVVPHLPPEALHQLIRHRGFEASGELVTSATPAQLTSLARPRSVAWPSGGTRRTVRRPTLRRMDRGADNDDAAYLERGHELAILANVLLAGCPIQSRPFTPQEASDAAAATCNLGLEYWSRHQAGPPDAILPDLAMLDMTAWIGVLGLLDECPVLPAALTAVAEGRAAAVSQTEFAFISAASQLDAVRAFMRELPDVLSG